MGNSKMPDVPKSHLAQVTSVNWPGRFASLISACSMSASLIPVNGGQRRSPRIALLIPINVTGCDLEKCAFSEAATATNLNLHGAAIHLNRQLVVGSVIAVSNRCGIESPARIVSQVGVVEGEFIYGIEFVQARQPNFLGVSFYASKHDLLVAHSPTSS